ncbi:hypothetical protein GCM10018783_55610 [Streptomyces griseosporeus]|nr:hypothetical protein GCM10018783_55610 [Streptomyces griseosporeus]
MRRLLPCVTVVALLALGSGTAVAAPSSPRAESRAAVTAAAEPSGVITHGADDVCNYTNQRPTLKTGSSGRAVQQAQCYLNNAIPGLDLDEDGDFGPVTARATKQFQRCAGITVDGVIAAQTWSFLVFWANSTAEVC